MKKFILTFAILVNFVGMIFADNNICEIFTNDKGLSVFIERSYKDPNDTDITIQDFINVIVITSNGNKMRITDCKVKSGKNWNVVVEPLRKILEPYGEYKFEYISHGKKLSRMDVQVVAEGCN